MLFEGRNCSVAVDRPCIVGILNVTPDSFSDGGKFLGIDQALTQARRLVAEGAAMIDIGGESTRPGSAQVADQEELDRVLPVVEKINAELDIPLSVDTTKSVVAREALSAGAGFINDISGLAFDPLMAEVVAESGAGLIVMHTRGRPDKMQSDTLYEDIVGDVIEGLRTSAEMALSAGVDCRKIAIDPGIGFGKDVTGNLELLKRTAELTALGYPVMLGTSRKSFIGHVLGLENPGDRLYGTLATVALGYAGGARLFRVHDVSAARQAALMAEAVCKGAEWQVS